MLIALLTQGSDVDIKILLDFVDGSCLRAKVVLHVKQSINLIFIV